MPERTAIPIRWTPRQTPLEPLAVAGSGTVARSLARRLLSLDDATLRTFEGVSASDLLIVCGPSDALPWIDGVLYLGRDSGAPSLLLPTALEPDVPVALLERALVTLRRLPPPIAIFADPPAVASIAEARPIDRGRLTQWLEAISMGAPPAGERP